MPRRRTPANDALISRVVETKEAERAAHLAYKQAQDAHLASLRDARANGETLENLAEALQCSKQWVHKWTTFGREHNRVTATAPSA